MGFVSLHNHSDYSLLDGASQISKIVDRACDLGMDSIALTDHGVMYGVLDLVKKCKEKGIKPIIGNVLEEDRILNAANIFEIDAQVIKKRPLF